MKSEKERYWLFKTEPQSFSFAKLWAQPRRRTAWDGLRNFQARNFLRDSVQIGDQVFVYHSSSSPPGIAGLARVVLQAQPDPTAFDPKDEHFDPKSKPEAPTWYQVEIEAIRALPTLLSLAEIRASPVLEGLPLLQKGQRLSIQPVEARHGKELLRLAGLHT